MKNLLAILIFTFTTLGLNAQYAHWETSIGGLAVSYCGNQTVMSAMDPQNFNSGGLSILSNSSGVKIDGLDLYTGDINQGLFQKSVGIGDVELVYGACVPDTVCGTTTLSAPNGYNVTWYNSTGALGAGPLVIDASFPGLEDGIEAFWYEGTNGDCPDCNVKVCCPVVLELCCALTLTYSQSSCIDNTDGTFTATYDLTLNWENPPVR